MKKKILAMALAVLTAMAFMTGCGEEKYTPTFMYFVSGADADYDAEIQLFEELESEYDGKVKFDLHNIDETPEDKENFPVEDTTPVLIMLDTSNNISAMEFMCSDKETLVSDIEAAIAAK